MDKQMKEDYIKALNSFYYRPNNENFSQGKYLSNEYIRKMVEEKAIGTFTDTVANFDWETGRVKDNSSGLGNNNLNTISLTGNLIKESTVEKRLQGLVNIYSSMPLCTKRDEIEKKYNQLKEEISKIKKVTGEDLNRKGYGKQTKYISLNDKNKDILSELNSFISEVTNAPNLNAIQGDMFEYSLYAANLVMRNMTKKAIEKEFKTNFNEHVLGGNRSTVKIDLSKFVNGGKDIFQAKKDWKVGDKFYETIMPSQEKVDVSLTWDTEEKTPNTLISAKNVNLKFGEVHIVSGTSLLYLIQDESPDYVNHYLNIMSSHSKPDNSAISQITKMRANAKKSMRLIIAYKALSGNTYGRQGAELFIVNDNSKSTFHIFEISDILGEGILERDDDIFKINTVDKIFRNNIIKGEDALARIGRVIRDVHATKIYASINSYKLQHISNIYG